MAALPEEFSSLLIKFPVNKGQKISNLFNCCKMIIYCLSQRNCVLYIEKLQKNQIENKNQRPFFSQIQLAVKRDEFGRRFQNQKNLLHMT